ncbi:hypothetical protein FACS1894137_08390 [Spirochaetia bacterium]|nr:hypothetical protein FACS1894137_08390 [Spirochaetia bacterium]
MVRAKPVSVILLIILISQNFVACGRSARKLPPEGSFSASDDQFVALGMDDFFVDFVYGEIASDEFLKITDDVFIIDDGFLDALLDKYEAEVDDIFISFLTIDEYDDLIKNFKYQKELDVERIVRELDIKRIVTNVAIGAVLVLICVSLPALAPGLAPQAATILLAAPSAALIGAATDAAIAGVFSYIRNDGDLQDVFYDSIEAGAEGFKYGAMFTAGAGAFTAVKAARTAQVAAKQVQTGKNAARQADDFVNKRDLDGSAKNRTNNVVNKKVPKPHLNANGSIKPNQTYRFGTPPHENIYVGHTDELGRIVRVEAPDLQLKPQGRLRQNHNRKTPGKSQNDNAGHLIGDQFDGSPDLDNIVSQSEKINSRGGAYNKLEDEWAKAIREGKQVKVSIEIEYAGGEMRPSAFHINYEIDGEFFQKTILNI